MTGDALFLYILWIYVSHITFFAFIKVYIYKACWIALSWHLVQIFLGKTWEPHTLSVFIRRDQGNKQTIISLSVPRFVYKYDFKYHLDKEDVFSVEAPRRG